ncbi:hypothetical protein Hanom_Chr10g00872401 [Helianthus anomalus]
MDGWRLAFINYFCHLLREKSWYNCLKPVHTIFGRSFVRFWPEKCA